uniref:Multifunctional fusion protein n=1 Tax=Ciona intestinalis TaxID=7719 RepID=F6YDF4_CIOIN|nr:delta-1-pyrroline-5-carboxylate dehydrogenase, mitochondrial [Ciona intestinalis]|eukprot:XP_002126896.1 delta-1-pyrroline-5-carboxylate dehydrogenase, mitochondrial [Ciona intestinalis]
MLRLKSSLLKLSRFTSARCMSSNLVNEPIYSFTPGSKERNEVQEALKIVESKTEDVPIVIGGEELWTNDVHYQVSPYNHKQRIAKFSYASADMINNAIENSISVRAEWDSKPLADRAQILFKAADIFANEKRSEILATTMAGQAKNVVQAEIDAGPELIDFFRFNAQYALDLEHQQPLNPDPNIVNSVKYRGLEGFVAAISPFNFTAIGGNLAGTPALMGNVVLWKPSDTAMLASWLVYKVLRECGLPPGVIQFIPADGSTFGNTITSSEHLAGINFTGSVPTFTKLWQQVGANLTKYKTFPRLAGECGGKNFHFVHSSADVDSVVNGTIRSAFEFGGQKCSACSRAYIPKSLWGKVKQGLVEKHKEIKLGNPDDFSIFLSAVIDKPSYERNKTYLDHAKASSNIEVLAGGNCDDSVGYFVQPTIVECKDPKDKMMQEEIFGPVLSCYVYDDADYKEILKLINSTSSYGLTGSVFSKDESVIEEASSVLRNSAGNFYINDKSTGSVVGQQWFGGSRKSGTNDKPGSPHYVLKWVSPQAVKRSKVPLKEWKYPSMK